ncbi:MAG: hypothetical protein WEB58_16030 [Planctomycetaceae bacterium]
MNLKRMCPSVGFWTGCWHRYWTFGITVLSIGMAAFTNVSAEDSRLIFADDIEMHNTGTSPGETSPQVGGRYIDDGNTTVVATRSLADIEHPERVGQNVVRCNMVFNWCEMGDENSVAVTESDRSCSPRCRDKRDAVIHN